VTLILKFGVHKFTSWQVFHFSIILYFTLFCCAKHNINFKVKSLCSSPKCGRRHNRTLRKSCQLPWTSVYLGSLGWGGPCGHSWGRWRRTSLYCTVVGGRSWPGRHWWLGSYLKHDWCFRLFIHPVLHYIIVIFFLSSEIMDCVLLYLKIEFHLWARGISGVAFFYCHWSTALIKRRLLFSPSRACFLETFPFSLILSCTKLKMLHMPISFRS